MSLALDPQTAAVLATIYGEADASSTAAWAAIAHVICNRVAAREWAHLATPFAVVAHSGFDAYTQKDPPFVDSLAYLLNRKTRQIVPRIELLVSTCLPILAGKVPDDTDGAVLYYSPKTQAALHQLHPGQYGALPPWDFTKLQHCNPPGLLPTDDFLYFRYLT